MTLEHDVAMAFCASHNHQARLREGPPCLLALREAMTAMAVVRPAVERIEQMWARTVTTYEDRLNEAEAAVLAAFETLDAKWGQGDAPWEPHALDAMQTLRPIAEDARERVAPEQAKTLAAAREAAVADNPPEPRIGLMCQPLRAEPGQVRASNNHPLCGGCDCDCECHRKPVRPVADNPPEAPKPEANSRSGVRALRVIREARRGR